MWRCAVVWRAAGMLARKRTNAPAGGTRARHVCGANSCSLLGPLQPDGRMRPAHFFTDRRLHVGHLVLSIL